MWIINSKNLISSQSSNIVYHYLILKIPVTKTDEYGKFLQYLLLHLSTPKKEIGTYSVWQFLPEVYRGAG